MLQIGTPVMFRHNLEWVFGTIEKFIGTEKVLVKGDDNINYLVFIASCENLI